MKAIILAAGMGTRLGNYTKDLPKGMLNFAGKSLIERQIDVLRGEGINDISIVRGYMSNKINFSGIKYYMNKDFKNTNMVESLFKAEKELDGDVLLCYADIIYEKKVIRKILSDDSDIGVVVDEKYLPYWKLRLERWRDDLESLVIGKEGNILELGDTDCSLDKAKTRYVGLIKFSKKGTEFLKETYHENKKKYFNQDIPWLRSASFKKAYMTCMLQALINKGYEVKPIKIQKCWMEFDTKEDYEKANNWIKSDFINKFINLDNC